MQTTAIVNLKGGVAKTTTAINMAWLLANRHGKRVLLIDADSQANATEFFGVSPSGGNLANLLRFERKCLDSTAAEYCRAQVQPTEHKGLSLIAGDSSLMDLDLSSVKSGDSNPQVLRWLAEALGDSFDYCIIDCPPAFNAASAAALVAADDVIIPIKLDAFSLRGMGNLMQQITNMRSINPTLKISGLLPTIWYRTDTNLAAAAQLKAAGFRVYPPIRQSKTVDKMTYAQQPLSVCSVNSGAGRDYKSFVDTWMEV